ncbi:hypothetical protein GCM10010909_00880 [Acidocella aquatica]|uniref:Gram-positive cocci surface proteins LPxTG domain-containing protein n=1 Tax=Acidocella aquatica TaxID=1922313 RepID=A0ABQ5ZYX0_9PROT|nr:hypothetical protein [Acidocella aquatica]GLR65410.1 hypothetical protein GCM10010909_00880 [Acidocella aquatica]
MSTAKSPLIVIGIVVLMVGLAAVIIPTFTTRDTNNVAQIGTLKIQTQEDTPHTIPPLLSGGAILLGVVLIAGGLFRKN